MRLTTYFAALFFATISICHATLYIVDNVKVSATADSAAAAREKAIQQGYTEAYNMLMIRLGQEGAQTRPDAPDPQDLMNMVLDFSVDREKNTATSYSALMTFQFDSKKIDDWVSGLNLATSHNSGPSLAPSNSTGSLTIFITVTDLRTLMNMTTSLLSIPGVKGAHVTQLTTRSALISVDTGLTSDELLKAANEKNLNIVIQ